MAQIVVWGTGGTTEGRFKPKKTVASPAIVPKIKIDWGGSVSYLAGNSATKTNTFNNAVLDSCTYNVLFGGNNFNTPPCHRVTFQYVESGTIINNGLKVLLGSQMTYFNQLRDTNYSYDAVWKGNPNVKALIREIKVGNYFYGIVHGGTTTTSYNITYSSQTFSINSNFSILSWKVTTNTGATEQRNQSQEPIIFNTCAIAVTYSDNTKTEINLSSCPAWVRLEDDQACPAGSCECVHDGYKCCIDPVSGVVVKKIRL